MLDPQMIDCVPRIYSNKWCRGIVMSDVLAKGLNRGAIATRKLKGVNRDKGHEVYTGLAPYGEGKILRSSFEWHCLCLDNQGANRLT